MLLDSEYQHIKQIANDLQNPYFLALVKMIRLYIKFNQEEEFKAIRGLVNRDKELKSKDSK